MDYFRLPTNTAWMAQHDYLCLFMFVSVHSFGYFNLLEAAACCSFTCNSLFTCWRQMGPLVQSTLMHHHITASQNGKMEYQNNDGGNQKQITMHSQ